MMFLPLVAVGCLSVALFLQTVTLLGLISAMRRYRLTTAKLLPALYQEIAAKDGLIATLQRKAEAQQRWIDALDRRYK